MIRIRIAGSSTVFPVANGWATAFMEQRPEYEITVEGGGSSSGARRVCALPDDETHVEIGDMSRNWKTPKEASFLDDGYSLQCAKSSVRVTQIAVATDGLAVVMASGGAAQSCLTDVLGGVTLAQLRWVFTDWPDAKLVEDEKGGGLNMPMVVPNDDGDGIKEWRDLDPQCEEVPIGIYGPGDQSGTYDFFGETVFCKNCFKGKDGYSPETFD